MDDSYELKHLGNKQPWQVINEIINSSWISQATYVIAKLGIPDILKNGTKHYEEIALIVEVHAPSLYRLLRLLVGEGLFYQDSINVFGITSLGAVLQTDHPNSMRYAAIYLGSQYHWNAWGNIMYSIKTGKAAFDDIHGMDFFTYLSQNSEASIVFNESMKKRTILRINEVMDLYDFNGVHTIVDVGGGKGTLLSALLTKYPDMKGIVFDSNNVIESAKRELASARLSHRCECIAGNFLQYVPESGNIYILSSIIHDWDDEHAVTILKNCRNAMTANSKVLLLETIVEENNTPTFAKAIDLEMLVTFGGKERTIKEYRELLIRAELKISKVIPYPAAGSGIYIIECETC